MSYVVLARKWRPQSFEDLVGQSHVSQTLANAIAQNRVAHAFLFTGVRGVGKTTSARILAKALNCAKGPTATPCNACPQCLEITSGQDVDVQEIDGASYNGVDEVRRLQESLPYRPQRDRFKIFIVDEVHMLSNAAWNAFLKTLEEPPPHVKFIFATTEVHKVPVTILSRCQRYDFKLLSAHTIAERLKYVLGQEKIPFEDGAVSTLAREAAGSMRDAMSLLDQVIAWLPPGEKLTAEGVAKVLGVADRAVLHRLAEAVITGDAAAALATVAELADGGYDLPHVAKSFLAHLRDLVVAKVSRDPAALLDMSDVEAQDVKAVAAKADADDLARIHLGFSKAFDDVTKSGATRAALEMTLVRLAHRPPLVPVDELLRRLADLEQRLGGGGSGPAGGGRPAPPRPPPGRPNPGHGALSAPEANVQSAPSATWHAPNAERRAPDAERRAPDAERRAPDAQRRAPDAERPVPDAQRPAADAQRPAPSAERAPANVQTFSAAPPAPAFAASFPPPPPGPVDVAGYRAVLDGVRKTRPALASVLEHAALLRFDEGGVTLAYEASSFLAQQATDAASRALLQGALKAHFGHPVELRFETIASRAGSVVVAQLDAEERKKKLDRARESVATHPLVTAALRELGAELKEVVLPSHAG